MAKAPRKKRTTKKATSSQGRRIRPLDHGQPTDNIEDLALYALGNDTFRVSASKPSTPQHDYFQEAIDAAIANGAPIQQPTPEEKAYCEGWLYCVHERLGKKRFDEKLVIAIKEHIDKDDPGPVSG